MKKRKNTLFDTTINEETYILWVLFLLIKYDKIKKKVKKRKNPYKNSIKKKNRAKIRKKKTNDYIDNEILYKKLIKLNWYKNEIKRYGKLSADLIKIIQDSTKEFLRIRNTLLKISAKYDIEANLKDIMILCKNAKDMINSQYNPKIREIKKQIDILEHDIYINDMYKVCKKLIKKYNFKDYPEADRKDMINMAMVGIYKSKPWRVFDVNRSNAAFSFFTATVFNYYRRYTKEYYMYNGYNSIKQDVLRQIIKDFDTKWCQLGINFNLAEGMDFEE